MSPQLQGLWWSILGDTGDLPGLELNLCCRLGHVNAGANLARPNLWMGDGLKQPPGYRLVPGESTHLWQFGTMVQVQLKV